MASSTRIPKVELTGIYGAMIKRTTRNLCYFHAHTEGLLDVTKAREVPRWRESDVFTPLERHVMEYAEAM